jgi:DNA-binding NarL/FixJ family response regulator
MVQGKSNKEIAYLLDVARTTISTYRMRIMEKLEVQDMAALLRLAIQHDSFLAEHPVSQDV